MQLIDDLWQYSTQILQVNRPELGPLTSTFLLSMSIPIVSLPIERIERHEAKRSEPYADDRAKSPRLSHRVRATLGSQPLRKAPFYSPGVWSFCECPIFNIAERLSDDIAKSLASPEAHNKADKMQTSQWCSILRNSLAHGGIVYLDQHGRYTYNGPVQMYLFVSGKYDKVDRAKLLSLYLLRIDQTNYRKFLRDWVKWLGEEGVQDIMKDLPRPPSILAAE